MIYRSNITPTLYLVIKNDYYSKNNNQLWNKLNIYLFVEIVNLWECLLNEVFLGVPLAGEDCYDPDSKLALIYKKLFEEYGIDCMTQKSVPKLLNKLERQNLKDKTLKFPQYFLKKDLIEESGCDCDDLEYLVKIRNLIIHYKANNRQNLEDMEDIVKYLKSKDIQLKSGLDGENITNDFFDEISTKECVKYFINFIFKMIRNLYDLLEQSDLATFRKQAYEVTEVYKDIK